MMLNFAFLQFYKKIYIFKVFVLIEFTGQDPPEVTFKGNEYLTYNLFEKSGEPILSIRDEVSLFFRTNRPEGLLFYTGTEKGPFRKIVPSFVTLFFLI